MRRKKLITAALCTVLVMASPAVGSVFGNTPTFAAATETELQTTSDKKTKSENGSGDTPQTTAETQAPQTAAETQAPPTTAPETQPQTAATETQTTATEAQTQTQTSSSETVPSESQTEPSTTPATETTPTETLPGTEGQSETTVTETTATELPTESETDAILTEEEETETDEETEEESETSEFDSNEELVAHQNIIVPPDISLEYRFTQVDECPAIVSNADGAVVYEEKSETAREVGELAYYGICYILEDSGDGWYYIESRNVRGFIHAEDVVTDEVALRIVNVKGLEELPTARLLVARTENTAFTYTHTTAQTVVVEKRYAVASGTADIHEQKKENARVTGTLADGGLCYILEDTDDNWVYVESGDARGFVKKSELVTGRSAAAIVSERGESNMSLATVLVEPEDNKACYYTLTSVQEASQAARTREAIVNFALQFVGNPYVWGGTSLTNGADCSGFVQSVYANFGYSLPRVADAQSVYGMQIPIESAEPGDLIFYARNGYVYHVSMYIGGGQVVHAAGRAYGIITSGISGNAVWATRIITD